jgi:phospholipase/carboxylesterase/glyoxalase family protein
MSGVHGFVHRFLPPIKPTALTLLMLHGTGGDEESLLALGSQLAPDAAILSPRGKVLEGSSPRFFRRKAEGVLDIEDLIDRTHELVDWIGAAAIEYHFSLQSLIAVGYSNGANIAASALLLHPGVLRRAILLRPMLPLQPDQAPDLAGTEVLIAAGKSDTVVPSGQADRLAQVLQGFGAQVTLQQQPTDHRLIAADISAARNWIHLANTFERNGSV